MFETKTEKNNKLFFFMIYSQYKIFLKLKSDTKQLSNMRIEKNNKNS